MQTENPKAHHTILALEVTGGFFKGDGSPI